MQQEQEGEKSAPRCRISIYLCYAIKQFYVAGVLVMFYNCYTSLACLLLLEKLDTVLGLQISTCAQKLYDSPRMPRLCSISHHNPAWLELGMKFRANWETERATEPSTISCKQAVCCCQEEKKVMVGYWRAIRHPDHFSSTGMLWIPSPNFAHAV